MFCRSRSRSYTPGGIFKNTALMRTSFRASFSRKNEPTLIGMDSDSMDREQSTFQMVPISSKQSSVIAFTLVSFICIISNPKVVKDLEVARLLRYL